MTGTQPVALQASARDALIFEHLPQVELIARRVARGMPASVSIDDLVSAGIVGLIAAIDRFDTTQGVKLKTYAEHKIRGAILDSLRGLAWSPRQQRKRARLIEAAIFALERVHGRAPEEDEIAQHLGITIAEYQTWLSQARAARIGSLDTVDDEEGNNLLRLIADSPDEWPCKLFERSELQALLAGAIAQLPATEQTILSLYYYDDVTLREIARVLELHESRVSQLKAQAVLRLRAALQNWWPESGAAPKPAQPIRAAQPRPSASCVPARSRRSVSCRVPHSAHASTK